MLLWDIEDVSSLQPTLEIHSPIEITTFEFHPKKYMIIGICIHILNETLGGAVNGQIVRWDLDKAIRESGITSKKGKNTKKECSSFT